MTVCRLTHPAVQPRRRSTDGQVAWGRAEAGSLRGDRFLMKAAALGDTGAWGDLTEHYVQHVWWSARGFGLSAQAAAEICELVWLRLAQALPLAADLDLAEWLLLKVRQEVDRTRARHTLRPAGSEI